MTINCRACGKKKNKFIYTTKKLPEYIWPSTNEKILKSSEKKLDPPCLLFPCSFQNLSV